MDAAEAAHLYDYIRLISWGPDTAASHDYASAAALSFIY